MTPGPAPQRAAPAWFVIKAMATTYLVLDLVATLRQLDGTHPGAHAAYGLVVVTAVLLCSAPRRGAPLLFPALVGCALEATQGAEVILLVLAPIVLLPRLDWRRSGGLVTGLAAAAVAIPFATETLGWLTAAGQDLFFLATATAVGFAVRGFQAQHRAGQARIEELEREAVEIRAQERTALARELHDVVAHQLSIISLQVMGHRDADDPEELREALDRVDDAARTAIGELQVLVRVLRDDDPGGDQLDRLAELSSPTNVADRLAQALHDNGFRVEMRLPAGVDRLERSLQRTLGRVLQKAVTNVLRHADPSAPVVVDVTINASDVRVEVSSGLPAAGRVAPLAAHSSGHGLRGLRERVSLVGGRLQVGPDAGCWVVRALLPRDVGRTLDDGRVVPSSGQPQTPVPPQDQAAVDHP